MFRLPAEGTEHALSEAGGYPPRVDLVNVVGPEGLLNSNDFNSLAPFGIENWFYGNQWLSKSLVPLFPAVSGPSFPLVLRPGRRA